MTAAKIRCSRVLFVVLLLGALAPAAGAANSAVSGSYEIAGKTKVGAATRITLRLHLTNRGQTPLYLQRVLLWDFAQPPRSGPRRMAMALTPGSVQETTQEFVVSRLQFEQWQKGLRPRVILDLQTPAGARVTQSIRLDRAPTRKGE